VFTQLTGNETTRMETDGVTRPVLILGAEPRAVVPIARSLHRRGIPVDVAGLSPAEPRLSSRAIRSFIRLPSHERPPHEFIAALTALIRAKQYDMLIPWGDTALALIAQHYGHLSTLLHVGCPPPHIVHLVLDKMPTLEAAQRCGIAIPATHFVSDMAELEALQSKLRFPMIAKPRDKKQIGAHAFKIQYFQTYQELRKAFELDARFGSRNLLQDYCLGDGLLVGMLIHDGEPVAMFQHRRVTELPYSGGVAVLTVSEQLDPVLAEHSLALLRDLEWEGIACVEFRYNRADKTAILMEVNGRYWAALAMAIHAGIDFPLYEWQLAHGEKPRVPSSYPIGLRARWTRGDLLRLHGLFGVSADAFPPRPAILKEAAHMVADWLSPTRDALWSLTDPLPAISELSRTLKYLAVQDLKRITKKLIPTGILGLIRTYRHQHS